MEKFTLLDNAMKDSPELLQVYIGADESAALAKAQEIAPGITAEEFAIYRANREQAYPAMQSLIAVFQKVDSDAVFAAKIDSCENFSDVYHLCGDIVTVPEKQFAAIYEQFRTAWDATHQADDSAELTADELASVVGGASFWSKAGKWIKKNATAVIGGVVGVAATAIGAAIAIFCPASPATAEMSTETSFLY